MRLSTLLIITTFFLFKNHFGQCDSTIIQGDFFVSNDTTLSGSYYVLGSFHVLPNVNLTVEKYSNNLYCKNRNVLFPVLSNQKMNQKFEEIMRVSFSRIKLLLSDTMLKNKVFDREVGSDTLIVIQIFTVFLILIFIGQFFI